MSTQTPTIALLHGAFAESASWNPVIERLHRHGPALVAGHSHDTLDVVAIANPLRSSLPPVATGYAASASPRVLPGTQRPATQAALSDGLPTDVPAWKDLPSWFVYGDQDLNIPAELHRFMAERAGSRRTREITGASHAISVSNPDAVTATILDAVAATMSDPVAA